MAGVAPAEEDEPGARPGVRGRDKREGVAVQSGCENGSPCLSAWHVYTRHPAGVPAHLAIMEAGSKAELVISATDSCSWYAFSAEITGA